MDGVGFIMVGYQDILVALAVCIWEPSYLIRVNFPVIFVVLRRTRLVSSDYVDGGN